MVTNRKLTIESLTKLGAHKLAELLIAEAAGNRRLKQTLNLAVSTKDGPVALGAILRKRLVTLAQSHSMLSYDRGRELIAELDGLRTTIIETISAKDSELACELLWKFLDLHPSILERCRRQQRPRRLCISNGMRRSRAASSTGTDRTGGAGRHRV